MAEPSGHPDAPDPGEERKRADRVGDALRSAVERTLATTAEGAAETRQRAGELLDEVARRGVAAREEVSRRGEAAREEVTRRGEEASNRLADAIADLRLADRDDLGVLSDQIRELEARLGSLERMLRRDSTAPPAPGPAKAGSEAESNPQVETETKPSKPLEEGKSGSDA